MGFPRQEYWSGLPFPPPGDLLDPGTEAQLLRLLRWQLDSFPLSHLGEKGIIMGFYDIMCVKRLKIVKLYRR